jgi:hypothetical protein
LRPSSHQPSLPGETVPASEALRDWYRFYEEEFRRFFPEHNEPRLPGREDWEERDYEQLPAHLQARSAAFAAATSRSRAIDSTLALGVLARDYASELAPFSRALGFSLDELVRETLQAPLSSVPTAAVYELYAGVLEQIDPSPAAMFLAFAMTDGTPIAGRWAPIDLFAAAGIDPPPTKGLQPAASVLRHANNDNPSPYDRLGFEPLVRGLRDLLDDQRTELPLSIGVTAPWGAGKSSLMAQLRAALARSRPPGGREWIPIGFDAWKYERSERIWAALSRAIYEQGQAGWTRRRRAWFRIRLEFRRRGALALLWGPALVLALFAIAAVVVLLHVSTLAGLLALAAVALSLGAVPGLLWGALTDPFKRALDDYTQSPSYEEQLGFTSAAERDIRLLTKQLTKRSGSALIVFVDDLDRCSPGYLVEAIEAINQIFNATAAGRCVFVLGIDRDMVAAGIEVAYAATICKLPKARRKNFGLRFLAKIVQLAVAVPTPDEIAIERLVDGLGAPAGEARSPAGAAAPARSPAGVFASAGSAERAYSETDTPDHDITFVDAEPSSVEAVFEPISFDEDSPEFREAERFAVANLHPNPRDVKRFDNAFRLQLHVAANTPGCGLSFDRDELIAIAKWVVIRLRWPDFAAAIDADVALLGRLEAAFNSPAADAGLDPNGLESDDHDWVDQPALRSLLADRRPRARIGQLHEQTFLRVS